VAPLYRMEPRQFIAVLSWREAVREVTGDARACVECRTRRRSPPGTDGICRVLDSGPVALQGEETPESISNDDPGFRLRWRKR